MRVSSARPIVRRWKWARRAPGAKRHGTPARGAIRRVLTWMAFWRRPSPPGSPHDPYAWTPAPVKRPPGTRRGAVALEEPREP